MKCRLVAAALLLAASQPACAQELRGTVLDSASRIPIAGVVLLLLDADGRALARNLTNGRGQYSVALSPAMRRVRLLRLGFRSRQFDIPALSDGVARLDMLLPAIPRLLERVVTTANPLCPRRRDSETAFALWQQARTGLLATIVAREAKPARVTSLVYYRKLAGMDDRISLQRVRIHSGVWTQSFGAALSAEEFVRSGFMRPEPDGDRTWFGPDAEVLMEEAFQAGYCFSLAGRVRSRPTQIGLRFMPARRQRGRVDIDGTFWIDTAARAIRDIEFRYVGLEPGASRYRPGGRVEFRGMPNGVVLVDRWSLRMLTPVVYTGRGPLTTGRDDTVHTRRFEVSDGGGEIARAVWPDGTAWRAPLGALRLTVVDRSGAPVAGRRIQLDSTDYAATTDSTGTVTIDDLLPGPYTAFAPAATDSAFAAIGIQLDTAFQFVASRISTVQGTMVVTTADDAVARFCGRISAAEGRSLVVARVVTPDGTPIEATLWELGARRGVTEEDGLFASCTQAPAGSPVTIRVWTTRGAFHANAGARRGAWAARG